MLARVHRFLRVYFQTEKSDGAKYANYVCCIFKFSKSFPQRKPVDAYYNIIYRCNKLIQMSFGHLLLRK